jgi:uncharacterized protein YlxW (UPF0749 family)
MNATFTRFTQSTTTLPLSVMSLVLGFMISTSVYNNQKRTISSDANQRDRIASFGGDAEVKILQQQQEIAKLQQKISKLETSVASDSKQAKVLYDSLQDLKASAGLTAISGPGVVVTLKDKKDPGIDAPLEEFIIHDRDVLKVVNELWASGAEAIVVNDIRIGLRSNFRCVGPTILVDTERIGTPVIIRAIGDGPRLASSIQMPGGIYDELRQTSEAMIKVETAQNMTLPPFNGPLGFKLGKPVKPKDTIIQDKESKVNP